MGRRFVGRNPFQSVLKASGVNNYFLYVSTYCFKNKKHYSHCTSSSIYMGKKSLESLQRAILLSLAVERSRSESLGNKIPRNELFPNGYVGDNLRIDKENHIKHLI